MRRRLYVCCRVCVRVLSCRSENTHLSGGGGGGGGGGGKRQAASSSSTNTNTNTKGKRLTCSASIPSGLLNSSAFSTTIVWPAKYRPTAAVPSSTSAVDERAAATEPVRGLFADHACQRADCTDLL